MRACIFCEKIAECEFILENEFAAAFEDKYPVTEGHTLVVPKRHYEDFFMSTKDERAAIYELLEQRKSELLDEDSSIDGFNAGVNIGLSAGQTVFHVHIHLIPRRTGDMPNPKGGVRGVIPGKMKY